MKMIAILFVSLAAQAAELHVKHGHFATSDGARLHYLEAGSGQPIVFVPGWMVPGWMWQPQIAHFSTSYRVVAMDPRAQGESEQVTEGLYPERRAQDIKELVEHLRLAPAVVVGHSMAVRELLSYVDQFGMQSLAGLVLVDGKVGQGEAADQAEKFFARVREISRDRLETLRKNRSHYFKNPPPPDYISRLDHDVAKMPTTTAVALLAANAGTDYSHVLGKINKPVLYAITPQNKDQANLLKGSVPAARVEIFENSAHVLFMDEPDRFNRVLEEFARAAFAQSRRND